MTRVVRASLWVCLAVGVFFRFHALDHLPGINGDEAYFAIKTWMTLHGVPIAIRTTAGSIPDVTTFGLSLLVQLVTHPSPVALRLPVAIAGVLTIVAAYFIARRFWGRDAGLVAAVLTSCLPPHIVYSRFMWEPSQTPLVCALWLLAAFSGSVFFAALAGMLAISAHPTNIFLLPMVIFILLFRFDRWGTRFAAWRARPSRTAAAIGVLVAITVVVGPYMTSRGGNSISVMRRLGSPTELANFARLFSDVITGSASYRYIVGPIADGTLTAYRIVYLAVFVLPVTFSLFRDWRRAGVEVAGFCASLLLFYVMAGPYAVSPATERYGLWMTMPHVFIATLAWTHLWRDATILPGLLTVVVSAGALIDFNAQYFSRLQVSNSVTENAFKTATVEPKLQAVRLIEAQVDPARRTRVYCEDWWTYWAVRYFSLGKSPDWEVTILNGRPNKLYPAEATLPDAAPETRKVFYVGYSGWRFTGIVLKQSPGAVEQGIVGYGGIQILSVFTAK